MEQVRESATPKAQRSMKASEKEDDDVLYEAQILEEFYDQINEIVNNLGKPYDASEEVAPSLPAYHPSFKLAEEACEQIASDAVRQLRAWYFADSDVAHILDNFEEKGKIVYQSSQKVGLIGNSGVGKSKVPQDIRHQLLNPSREKLAHKVLARHT